MSERAERMAALGLALQEARVRRGLTQAQVAERCGTADSNVSMFERGRKVPSPRVCVHLAAVLELDVGEILLAAEAVRKRPSGITDAFEVSNLEVLPDRLKRVPVFDIGAHFDGEWTDGCFPKGQSDRFDWVLSEDPEAFGCILHGDSMEPGFHEGDLLIFEPSQTIEDGDFILLRTRDWATFKQVFIEDKRYRLTALNRRYPDVFLDRASDEILQLAKMTMHVRRY